MLEQYYRINEATGVSIQLLQNGGMLINVCGVAIKDNHLDIEKKATDLPNVEELTKTISPKAYLAINLFGKGILQKQIEKVAVIDAGNFSQILPNANFDDFYIQNFISGNYSFASVIRKADADKLIDLVKEQGFIPLMLTLGPFPIENIISQLNVYEDEIMFNGHLVRRNEQKQWITYQYKETATSPFPLKIESEPIAEKLLLAYANAFQLVLAEKLNVIQAGVPGLSNNLQKVLNDKKLQVKGFVILSVFFVLLLINFMLFSWLNSSNAGLTEQVSRYAQSNSDIQGINDQIKNKEALLQNLGWDGGINKSVLVDQLASLLPADVSWREVTINPIDATTSRMQKTLQFMDRKIRIIGNSQKIIPVNEWIARAKTQKWVKNIQLDSYTYNSELNTGQFTVIIDY